MTAAPAPDLDERHRRIRIAYFIDSMAIGGTELNAIRTAERLDRERFELSVFCHRPEGPLRARYDAAGIPVHPVPVTSYASLGAMRRAWAVARQLRAGGVDIVHTHDRYTNIFGGLAARLAGTPAVIASRRWWEAMPRSLYRSANRRAYRAATCVLANSPAVGRLLVEHDHVPADKVTVVPNFVDEDAFRPPAEAERARLLGELGIPAGALLVGIVANLRPVKDHATLLRAFARLPPEIDGRATHLVLVGGGPAHAELEQLAGTLGLEARVHLAGQRPPLPNLHHLFDVSVLCSVHEGFPNSVTEAMAAGRAVVATAVGGVPDAVEERRTGLLVPPGDPARLAEALLALLTSASDRERMGALGRRVAEERFGARQVLTELESLYRRLAAPVSA